MGNNCNRPPPDTTNVCHVSVGDRTVNVLPNFCTIEGIAGNTFRDEYCSMLSSAGEWGNASEVTSGCAYSNCDYHTDVGFGCCGACCGVVGGSATRCQRLAFTGEPIQCCFNDLICNDIVGATAPPACFSDRAKQNTCADGNNGQPNYRSIVSTDCQDVLLNYCAGTLPTDDPTSTAWLDRWLGGTGAPFCAYALYRNMFDPVPGQPGHCFPPDPIDPGVCNISPRYPLDAQGYFWAQRMVEAAITHYQDLGYRLGSFPGQDTYNPWQDFLYTNVCCPYPGLCQTALASACATTTAQRLSFNPILGQWCGCHLNTEEYQSYSVKYNIPPQCSPMCNRGGTIPIVNGNGDVVNCTQRVCLIDDITLNIVGSQVGGGVNFDQVCAGCTGGVCSCIVSDNVVDINNSIIGGNVLPINQGCGTLTCTQTNPGVTGPQTIPISCGTGASNPIAEYEDRVQAANAEGYKNAWLITLVFVLLGLVGIYLIIWLIHPDLRA